MHYQKKKLTFTSERTLQGINLNFLILLDIITIFLDIYLITNSHLWLLNIRKENCLIIYLYLER